MTSNRLPPWQIRQATRCLHQGGVLAYPTEAVYGLGCDPLNPHAIARLLWLKGRAAEKGLIVIASAFEQLSPFVSLADVDTDMLMASWPGPVTWVVPAAADVPVWITGGRHSIAVRVTAHPLASALCDAFNGALISTSANTSGRQAACHPLQVRQRLRALPDMIISGATGDLHSPTPIRDAVSGQLLRA